MFKSANQEIDKLQVNTLFDMGQLVASGPKVLLRVQNKTASYQVTNLDSGTIFTNVGDADAIVYTLPALPIKGLFYFFVSCVNQNMSVASAVADQIRTKDDLDADACTFVSANNLIGAALLVIGQGSFWLGINISGCTMTVTT